ncbi:MAG: type II CAAX endopeptidase family protein [Anaerolineae bacterium]|nr:type II CAAX endopeptidase family protein [Anaerolineae bacterium]
MRRLFWNAEQGRLRTLWRLLGQAFFLYGGLIVLGLLVGGLVYLLLRPPLEGGVPTPAWPPLLGVLERAISALVAVGSVWLASRLLDRRRFADLGFHLQRAWWLDLGFGLALGAVLMLGIFLVEWGAGWITVTGVLRADGPPLLPGIAAGLLAFIAVGFYEELISRGYQLHNLAEGLNFRPLGLRWGLIAAWVASSVVFGLLHAANPNATARSTALLVLAGLFLGLGYILTGELAIPIGLHVTWNFFQGNVFGFPVSGMRVGASVIAISQGGPELATGGAFGPEAGLVGAGAILAGSLATAAWVRWRYGRLALCERLPEPPGHERGG